MRRLVMRFAAGIGALALVGTLGACATQPSTAATVGPDRITVAEVNAVVDSLPMRFQPSEILNIQMRALAAQQVAEGRGITDLHARAVESLSGTELLEQVDDNAALRDLLIDLQETTVLREQMGTQAMAEAFADIPVTINPRYGMTGLEELQAVRVTSLSLPASQPR